MAFGNFRSRGQLIQPSLNFCPVIGGIGDLQPLLDDAVGSVLGDGADGLPEVTAAHGAEGDDSLAAQIVLGEQSPNRGGDGGPPVAVAQEDGVVLA